MSASINFPAEHYIGILTARQSDDLPLAFMTPQGTDKAAEKRKATVDSWVDSNARVYDHVMRQYREDRKVKPTVRKNEPMSGFRVLHSVKRDSSWGSGNVKWRVEDPRGFELEISSPNMMAIMACSVIDQGEILDACMWAREGKENVLVPISSEVYTETVANTERLARSASLKDLKIGHRCVLKNGTKARFIGKMFKLDYTYDDRNYSYRYGDRLVTKVDHKPVWIFIEEDEDGSVLELASSPKLSDIIPDTEMTKEEAEVFLREHRARPRKSSWWRKGYGDYTFFKSPVAITRELIPAKIDCGHAIAWQHPDTQEWCISTSHDLDTGNRTSTGGIVHDVRFAKADLSALADKRINEEYASRDRYNWGYHSTAKPEKKISRTILEYLPLFRAVTYLRSEDGNIDLTIDHN